MSNYYKYYCKTCNVPSQSDVNHGHDMLCSVALLAQQLKALDESDKEGYLDIAISNHGREFIRFLIVHCDHELEIHDEFGKEEAMPNVKHGNTG